MEHLSNLDASIDQLTDHACEVDVCLGRIASSNVGTHSDGKNLSFPLTASINCLPRSSGLLYEINFPVALDFGL